MKIEETKNTTETTTNVKTEKPKPSFLRKNIVPIILLVILIAGFAYFSIKINNSENRFKEEKTQMITKYETEKDSLKITQLEFASTVFSWSVRSELMRNNTENLNQLLTVFVKKSGAELVQLIKPENNVVLLSSDKKFEGLPYNKKLDNNLSTTMVLKEEGLVRIITPVMGLNNKIGVLVVEVKK